jgi:hypothetical protein
MNNKFLVIIFFIFNSQLIISERILKMKDIAKSSYVPVKLGETFTIEIESDDQEINHTWILENGVELAKKNIVYPFNLKKDSSVDFYHNIGKERREVGRIYHFKFESKKSGDVELMFVKKIKDKVVEKKPINIKISNQIKDL